MLNMWHCSHIQGHLSPVSICNIVRSPKSQSREICIYNSTNILKFYRHIGSSAAEVPVKFQARRWFELTTSRLRDFTRSHDKTSYRILKREHKCRRCFTITMLMEWTQRKENMCQQWSYRCLYLRLNIQTSICWLLSYPRCHQLCLCRLTQKLPWV